MKHFVIRLLVLPALLILFPLHALASETYEFDPMHTYVLWHINHFGFSIQTGKFTMVEGKLVVDDAKPQNSQVNVTIPMQNIATGIPKLDEHLASSDFFDVKKFPTASFKSTKVEVTGKNTGKVYGKLTMMGVTKPVTLDVKLLKEGMHPMKNKKSLGFKATASFKRSEFGLDKYAPALGDEVQIEIGAEANLEK
ncbi:Protein YceI [Aquicella siphonis]|uniref:Protein YceI n=1 Tax=Aquicella siphonis TaxID=254247 RepID=A0A5E4PGQ1_9COXI|nr:YceI family protein [Aquicella siphonis]VVC75637.1 Protein YceI [Aquicella siphonis]